jgi:uncharacterized repeat protein (TIGR01451 family)
MAAATKSGLAPRRAIGLAVGVLLIVLSTTGRPEPARDGTASLADVTSTATVNAAASGPQLSIAVDDGRSSAVAGDSLTYTITVRNLGTADVAGLTVTQSLPTGLTLDSTDPPAEVGAGGVRWTLDLKATGDATFHSRMTVSKTPAALLRMATVACASTSGKGPPVVCAAHSDQLPAGAAEQARQEAMSSIARTGGIDPWYVAGAIGLAGVVLLTALLRRHRKRHAG